MLQPDPGLTLPPELSTYLGALAAGDSEAAVAAFEPDGHLLEAVGAGTDHRGTDALRAFHHRLFAEGHRIRLQGGSLVDDGRLGALEYDVVPPTPTGEREAGIAVFERGPNGRLAALRVYDTLDPALVPGG